MLTWECLTRQFGQACNETPTLQDMNSPKRRRGRFDSGLHHLLMSRLTTPWQMPSRWDAIQHVAAALLEQQTLDAD